MRCCMHQECSSIPMPWACVIRLKAALKSTMSLELGPKGLLVFENYAKGNNSSAHLKQRKGIPGERHRPPPHTCVSKDVFFLHAYTVHTYTYEQRCLLGLIPSTPEAHTATPGARLGHQHQRHRLLERQPWRHHRLLPGLLCGGPTRRYRFTLT